MRRPRAVLLGLGPVVAGLLAAAPAGAQAPPPASEPSTGGLVYVAMGDSFTAGPFVANQIGPPVDCARSDRNYPHLAAAALGVGELRDVSCSGATIDDFAEPQGPLSLGSFNVAQNAALGPDVDVVTVGIGGNDVGFVSIALGCVRLLAPPLGVPCAPAFTAGGVDQISQRIVATGAELADALATIGELAPNAEVLVVGYPASLPDDGVACFPYLPILPEDMRYLVEKFKEMNAMLAAAAAAADATYVDIYTSSIGHDACQLPGVAWVNGFVLLPLSFPAHPNELSFANSAPIVAEAIRSQVTGRPAPIGAPAGPGVSVAPAIPPRAPLDPTTAAAPVVGSPRPAATLASTGPGSAAAPVAAGALVLAAVVGRRAAGASRRRGDTGPARP